jgi:hypothetical protein
MDRLGKFRTVAAVAVTVLIMAAATAGAARLITGADVKDGSLAGKELKYNTIDGTKIKDGTLGVIDTKNSIKRAVPVRVTAALPSKGFEATNGSVLNTPDGVTFGPYADGGAAGGSICTGVLNGHPLNDVTHLAFQARYTAEGDTGGVGVPYLRIFLENDSHDAIFSPNTQPPDADIGEGPFHTWVATAGVWRYDDDAGAGGEYGVNGAPFAQVKADHGTEAISSICISVGFTAGANLTGLLRTWEINMTDYAFGH